MPPGKHELSITINQCLLLDWRFELGSIKISFIKTFQWVKLGIIQPQINTNSHKNFQFFMPMVPYMSALHLHCTHLHAHTHTYTYVHTYVCQHISFRNSLCLGRCVNLFSLNVSSLMDILLKPFSYWSLPLFLYKVRAPSLFSSLVHRWVLNDSELLITWDNQECRELWVRKIKTASPRATDWTIFDLIHH